MNNEDLQQLKALAEKIKSGNYSINEGGKFIDVSGPDSILALIERIESIAAPAVANAAPELLEPEYCGGNCMGRDVYSEDQMCAAIKAAILTEREACAEIAENQTRHIGDPQTFYTALGQAAGAIRSRK